MILVREFLLHISPETCRRLLSVSRPVNLGRSVKAQQGVALRSSAAAAVGKLSALVARRSRCTVAHGPGGEPIVPSL